MGRTAEAVTCKACGVTIPVEGRWRQRSICRDAEACIERMVQNLDGEPDGDWSVSDIRPADLHVCSTCKGDQEVPATQDWETGYIRIIPCPRCGGTGVDPGW